MRMSEFVRRCKLRSNFSPLLTFSNVQAQQHHWYNHAVFGLQQCPVEPSSFRSGKENRYFSSSSSLVVPHLLPPPAISKVLVANRGEIACRVIRTCRRLGIPTAAVYSVADGPQALHAQMADEAYLIGSGPTPGESYLRQEELVQLAQQVGVEAIHPGYGFLSENSNFAERIQQTEGLVFVGPPTSAIRAMGSKSESKALMDAAGVPTTPGFYETADVNNASSADIIPQDVDQLRQRAVEIGFPVLIKAVMGGGGKGMRLVWNEADFLESLASCQREAAAAFGNEHVLLEKYLVRPRHVEVQIIADTHANVVSLYERDCSLQRRHQKIIEEAPAADLPMELRQQFGEMGRRAAEAVGYVNAGTVEFLLDTQSMSNSSLPNFYFCEMNTRLQVEHPITEAITGVDLVEWQLRVAAGEPLPISSSDDIPCQGHAFEARIYAEQPTRQFLPATGHVWHHSVPTALPQDVTESSTTSKDANFPGGRNGAVRVDTSLQTGHNVSVYYDPMISKLIVHGENRTDALNKLIHALRNYEIAGVPTNIDFLIQCARHPTFQQAGAINTGFLEDFADDLNLDHDKYQQKLATPLAQVIGTHAVMLCLEQRRNSPEKQESMTKVNSPSLLSSNDPWSTMQGSWRLGGSAGRARRTFKKIRLSDSTDSSTIECISNPDGSFEIIVPNTDENEQSENVSADTNNSNSQSFHISGGFINETGNEMEVQINGSRTVYLTCVLREHKGYFIVNMWPKNLPSDYAWEIRLENPYSPEAAAAASLADGNASADAGITVAKAPMPGKISRINSTVGSMVNKGDVVLVMEAMKMEHPIKANMDGIVENLHHNIGDIVGHDDILFELATHGRPKEST